MASDRAADAVLVAHRRAVVPVPIADELACLSEGDRHSAQPHRSPPPASSSGRYGREGFVVERRADVDPDVGAAELQRGQAGGAGPGERVQHHSAGWAAGRDRP